MFLWTHHTNTFEVASNFVFRNKVGSYIMALIHYTTQMEY